MGKITGLGGVFLKLNTDTLQLLKWYKEYLGLDVTDFGVNFLEAKAMTLLTFERGDNDAILNFAVEGIEDFIEELKGKGVTFHKELQTYPYGKFAQIIDVADNVIELCELEQAYYKDMVEKEIADFSSKEGEDQ